MTAPEVDLSGSHPCPVPGCHGSAEEHHRVNVGLIIENADLRRRLREPEVEEEPEAVYGLPLTLEQGKTYVLTTPTPLSASATDRIAKHSADLGVKFVVLDSRMGIAREAEAS